MPPCAIHYNTLQIIFPLFAMLPRNFPTTYDNSYSTFCYMQLFHFETLLFRLVTSNPLQYITSLQYFVSQFNIIKLSCDQLRYISFCIWILHYISTDIITEHFIFIFHLTIALLCNSLLYFSLQISNFLYIVTSFTTIHVISYFNFPLCCCVVFFQYLTLHVSIFLYPTA